MSTKGRNKFIDFYVRQLGEREKRLRELESTGREDDAKVERFNINSIHDILNRLRTQSEEVQS